MKAVLLWGNLLLSGFMAISISMFFAEGTIAENYTDERFVAPEFLWMIPLWVVEAVLVVIYFYKKKVEAVSYPVLLLINLALWISIFFSTWVCMRLAV